MSELWGGRFSGKPDPRFAAFQSSLAVDSRLWREDIEGSVAWAHALARARVISRTEARRLEGGLRAIVREIEADQGLLSRSGAEDIHEFVESRLKEHVGDLARKLHTGRSRNDQVATDLKLYLRRRAHELQSAIQELQRALVDLAGPCSDLPMPGYTHLQRAQPVTVGHHLLAYVEMLERDRTRIEDAVRRSEVSPLGSGALAGTAYPIDRMELARSLGFPAATRNSLDAVSDRDHAGELAFACAQCMIHLSRLAEDWIFFATQEARFLVLSDAVATGSSLMPQKKNPDALELLRGKCARVLGGLQALLVLQKGLPLAYDKDLQEDKGLLFDALDTTLASLEVAAIVVRNARFDADRCRSEANRGYANATDLADMLVRAGLPFRTAHERTGAVVRAAIELGVEIEDLPWQERNRLVPELADLAPADWEASLSPEAGLSRRCALGGTAPSNVRGEVERWHERLGDSPVRANPSRAPARPDKTRSRGNSSKLPSALPAKRAPRTAKRGTKGSGAGRARRGSDGGRPAAGQRA